MKSHKNLKTSEVGEMWERLRRLVGMKRFVELGGYGEANVEEEVQILVCAPTVSNSRLTGRV